MAIGSVITQICFASDKPSCEWRVGKIADRMERSLPMDCFGLALPKGCRVGHRPVIQLSVGAGFVHGGRAPFFVSCSCVSLFRSVILDLLVRLQNRRNFMVISRRYDAISKKDLRSETYRAQTKIPYADWRVLPLYWHVGLAFVFWAL